jgi:hypothetical protein
MSRPAKSKGFSIVGPLEYDALTGEPGVHINNQWYGAFELWEKPDDLITQIFDRINTDRMKEKAEDFKRKQQVEPIQFTEPGPGLPAELWAYRNKVVQHKVQGFTQSDRTDTIQLVKHCVVSEDREMEKVRREIQAYENLEKLPDARREGIPRRIRLFVWQRDEGKCVDCGSQKDLEFDHEIPVVEGGATSERNIRLRCQTCNRRKGRNI